MVDIQTIERLLELARLSMDEEEKQMLLKDFDSILGYIDQITKVSVSPEKQNYSDVYNVMRDDISLSVNPETLTFLLSAFPDAENDYLKVKQILN